MISSTDITITSADIGSGPTTSLPCKLAILTGMDGRLMNWLRRIIYRILGIQVWTKEELDAAEALYGEWSERMRALFEEEDDE